jgi:mannose/fructose-specific phosphotransferase system component IIA
VLISHGRAADVLLETAREMVGELPQVVSVSTGFGEATDEIRRRVEAAVAEVDDGGGVLLIVDLCGSTPANVCAALTRALLPSDPEPRLEVLFGLSLPMLAKAASAERRLGTLALARDIRDSALRNVTLGSELWSRG